MVDIAWHLFGSCHDWWWQPYDTWHYFVEWFCFGEVIVILVLCISSFLFWTLLRQTFWIPFCSGSRETVKCSWILSTRVMLTEHKNNTKTNKLQVAIKEGDNRSHKWPLYVYVKKRKHQKRRTKILKAIAGLHTTKAFCKHCCII